MLSASAQHQEQLGYDQSLSLAKVCAPTAKYGLSWQCWLKWFCRLISLEPERTRVPVPNTLSYSSCELQHEV